MKTELSTLESERTDSQLRVSKAENTLVEFKKSLPVPMELNLK